MDKCGGCVNQTRCISATSVTTDLRKYFLKITGHRQVANRDMLEGKRIHEEYLKQYESLAEMGCEKFRKRLYLGEAVTLQEVAVCSPRYGLHGIIDKLEIYYTKDNNMKIRIADLKPWWSKKYYLQIATYGLILSDMDCMIAYDFITPRSHKKKRIAQKLYPRKEFMLDINLLIRCYNLGKEWETQWMRHNNMTSISQQVAVAILKKANTRKALHKHRIMYLDQLAPCKDCKQMESYCSLWGICKKVVYNPLIKERQRYIGKKQLLVKSRPL